MELKLFALLRQYFCFYIRARLCQRAVNGHCLRRKEKQGENCPQLNKIRNYTLLISNIKIYKLVHNVNMSTNNKAKQTCVTIPLMSPVLDGSRMVLDSLARLEKADTYCSATLKEAAALPFCNDTE